MAHVVGSVKDLLRNHLVAEALLAQVRQFLTIFGDFSVATPKGMRQKGYFSAFVSPTVM
jgi:hypothetical protein